jgi:hypothetical protein
MAHFALLDENNVVLQVFPGRDEDNEDELTARTGKTYKKTSYNTISGIHIDPVTREPSADQTKAFRKNFAGPGMIYDSVRDAFIPPKPYPSWILDESTCQWKAPIDKPNDDEEHRYTWNEELENWDIALITDPFPVE